MSGFAFADSVGRSSETPSLRPNMAVLGFGSIATTLLSFVYLPWPLAIASSVLGVLMIAGADVDARTLLLPDVVTLGAAVAGVVAAPILADQDPWMSFAAAALRAAGVAGALFLLRGLYGRFRGQEGLGLGDVKLAAAIGAWLPLTLIPVCFMLATTAALVAVLAHGREQTNAQMRLPFGAFLCPALWLIFFVDAMFP